MLKPIKQARRARSARLIEPPDDVEANMERQGVPSKVAYCLNGYCMGFCTMGLCALLIVGVIWLATFIPRL